MDGLSHQAKMHAVTSWVISWQTLRSWIMGFDNYGLLNAYAASCHCIALDVNGRCFTWGRNEVFNLLDLSSWIAGLSLIGEKDASLCAWTPLSSSSFPPLFKCWLFIWFISCMFKIFVQNSSMFLATTQLHLPVTSRFVREDSVGRLVSCLAFPCSHCCELTNSGWKEWYFSLWQWFYIRLLVKLETPTDFHSQICLLVHE
jgi:hypothetical protein